MRITLLFLISIWVLFSCRECDDCEVFIGEPKVTMVFINQDSLTSIQSDLNHNQTLIDSLSESIVELELSQSILADSIISTQNAVDQGELGLESTLESLRSDFAVDSLSLISFDDTIQQLDSLNAVLQSVSSTINSGLLLVSEIRNTVSGYSISREDSLTVYTVPLDFNNATTSLEFVIHDEVYELNMAHENELSVDERTRVNVSMTEIEVISHTFQSISLQCNTNSCASNETVIICYF